MTAVEKMMKDEFGKFGTRLFEGREDDYENNLVMIEKAFAEDDKTELVAKLVEKCPPIKMILAHMLENRFGWTAQEVSWKSVMGEWDEEDCRRVGQSLAYFARKRKTGKVAVDAWKKNYAQLEELFVELVRKTNQYMGMTQKTTKNSGRKGRKFKCEIL